MRKVLVMLVFVVFVTTGCTGSFNLTRKVYNWHRSQSDKWSDEFGFLVCALIPIYGISTFADAIVFNSIEFWTGKNPVEMSSVEPTTKQVKQGDSQATISYNRANQQLTIASADKPTVTVEKEGNMMVTKDSSGKMLSASLMNAQGQFLVLNQNLELVKSYSPEEIQAMKAKYMK